MSHSESPILVIPKKEELIENSSNQNTAASIKKNKFNLSLLITEISTAALWQQDKLKEKAV